MMREHEAPLFYDAAPSPVHRPATPRGLAPALLAPALLAALASGCAPAPVDCQASISPEMSTLPVISFSLDAPGLASVRYGEGDLSHQTEAREGSDHRFVLPGMPAEVAVDYQVTVDDQVVCEGAISTDPLPSGLPALEVTVPLADGAAPYPYFLGSVFSMVGADATVVVVDRQGRVVWYSVSEPGRFIVDPQLSIDGKGFIYNEFDSFFNEDVAVIRRVDLEGLPVQEVRTELGHHMFAQLPDGTLAYQALSFGQWTDPETGELQDIVGDTVMEIAPDGAVRQVLDIFDWLEVQSNFFFELPSLYSQGIDWTHGNALKYDAEQDRYLLSLGNAGVVLDIDRASGEPIDWYGAEGVGVAEGSAPLEHQHDPSWLDSGDLLVFTSDIGAGASGAVEYAIEGGELVEVWRYGLDGELFSALLGQATRYEGGTTMVNFGGTSVLREVGADDAILWELQAEAGYGFAQFTGFSEFPN